MILANCHFARIYCSANGGIMDSTVIRKRFRTLREERAWSQEDLAEQMGFNDRQTVSAIENGDRKITAEEMVKAASVFKVELGFFVDPFRLYGEAAFSWRQKDVSDTALKGFEEQALVCAGCLGDDSNRQRLTRRARRYQLLGLSRHMPCARRFVA